MPSPAASFVRYRVLSSSEPDRITGMEPSLFTAGISEDEPHTRATSSMTMHVASASAPWPPYSSGTWTAASPAPRSASCASRGNRPCSSTSAANGAIFCSHSARTDSRSMSCSSLVRNRSKVVSAMRVSVR